MAQAEANPRAVTGNNSRVKAGPISADRLKSFVERLEKLNEERDAIGGDIRDVYQELKGVGYDVKTTRTIVAIRKQDAADRAEQETLLDVYKHALGMDRAVAAVQGGASLREAAADHGVSKSALHRRVKAAVPETAPAKAGTVGEIIETLPAHDVATGEINPGDGAAGTAKPAGQAAPTEIKEAHDGAEGDANGPDGVAAAASEAGGDRTAAGTDAPSRVEEISQEATPAGAASPSTPAEELTLDNDLDDDLPDFDIAAASEPMSAEEIAALQAKQDERSRRAGQQPVARDEDDLTIPAFLRRAPVSELT